VLPPRGVFVFGASDGGAHYSSPWATPWPPPADLGDAPASPFAARFFTPPAFGTGDSAMSPGVFRFGSLDEASLLSVLHSPDTPPASAPVFDTAAPAFVFGSPRNEPRSAPPPPLDGFFNREEAQRAMALGVLAFDRGDLAKAQALFEKSFRMHPTAECQALLGAASRAAARLAAAAPQPAPCAAFTPEQAQACAHVLGLKGAAHHRVLGLPPRPPAADVKRAYRALALLVHPDKNPHPSASEAFALCAAAFGALRGGGAAAFVVCGYCRRRGHTEDECVF